MHLIVWKAMHLIIDWEIVHIFPGVLTVTPLLVSTIVFLVAQTRNSSLNRDRS